VSSFVHSSCCAARHVHKLSTMERAVGGSESFDEASPAIILRDSSRPSMSKNPKPRSLPVRLKSLKLHGDALSSRIGLLSAESVVGSDDFGSFPPTVLMASCSDTTVPWYESADMFGACQQCGIPAKLLVYNRVGHGDFVVNWHPSLAPDASRSHEDLEYYTSDLVNILLSS
jgi:hypothetical protein